MVVDINKCFLVVCLAFLVTVDIAISLHQPLYSTRSTGFVKGCYAIQQW